jgi:hypothetical protein
MGDHSTEVRDSLLKKLAQTASQVYERSPPDYFTSRLPDQKPKIAF